MTTLLEVRIAALEAASRVYAGTSRATDHVLVKAEKFEHYLLTGKNEG